MKFVRILGPLGTPFTHTKAKGIGIIKRTPVHGRADNVVAKRVLFSIVASRLHDVNLTATGPLAIHRVLRHHPDGRPHPVSRRKLSLDFDSTILDLLLARCGETSGAHGVDHGSAGGIAARPAGVVVGKVGETLVVECTGSISGEVDDVPVQHLILSELGSLKCQCWDDVEALLVDVGVERIIGGPVKRSGS